MSKALAVSRRKGPLEAVAGPHDAAPRTLFRIPDAAAKREAYAAIVADLKRAHKLATSQRTA